jgi:hypothetical protein
MNDKDFLLVTFRYKAPHLAQAFGFRIAPQVLSHHTHIMEIFTRLGLALVLSLGLAVLMAWGWDSAEPLPSTPAQVANAAPNGSR